MGYMIGGFKSQQGLEIFLFTATSRPALRPTWPPIQWVPGALSLIVMWLGHEADHSPPSSVEVKKCMELYLHSPHMPSWYGTQLKHRDLTLVEIINEPLVRDMKFSMEIEHKYT
jgi:hypothetical protein